jgi:hypothetical protein
MMEIKNEQRDLLQGLITTGLIPTVADGLNQERYGFVCPINAPCDVRHETH